MFRLLIADDEELVRRGLTALIQREAPEIDVVETAVDGLEALELSARCRPDILLTDIRMPGLSGLDLIGRLRAAGSAPRCIVLSGYDDFEYARRAIGLDVAEYLLKPVDPDQLLEALARVREAIAAARQEEQTRAIALQALQERHLRRLVSGAYTTTAPSAEWLPASPAWGLLLARWPDGGEASGAAVERFRALARQVIEGALLADDGPGACCLLCPLQSPDPAALAIMARSLHDRLVALALPVALITARPCTSLAALAGAYAEATNVAACARPAAGPLLCWEAAPGRAERWPMLPVSHREALLRAVAAAEAADAARLAASFVAYLEGHCAPNARRALCVEMLMLIIHQCQNLGLPADAILGPEGDIGALLAAPPGGIEAQLVALAGRAARACGEARPDQASRGTIPELRAYIAAHPAADLSTAALGRRMHLSPKYLGELFKAATGEPLGEYVIRTRMRHACDLLAGTPLKVYAVAGQVGYADAKHFATMFRAVIGVSPAEYRAAHRGGQAPPEDTAPCHP